MHFLDLLDSHRALCEAGEVLSRAQKVCLTGAPSAAWATLAAQLQRQNGAPLLLVTPDAENADRAFNDLASLFDEDESAHPRVLAFPVPDRAGTESADFDAEDRASASRGAAQQRLSVLDALQQSEGGGRATIIVATASALCHPTLPPEELRSGFDELVEKREIDREAFLENLGGAGYERVETVEAPGQFAARGGIIDFFPPATGQAIRLELWGDEIDSLRAFDVTTQRSTGKVESVRLTPPRETFLTPKRGKEVAEVAEKLLEKQLRVLASEDESAAEKLEERVGRDIEKLRDAAYFAGLSRYASLIYPDQPTLLEHLPENAVVIWAEPQRIESHIERLVEDDAAVREADAKSGAILQLPSSPLCEYSQLRQRAKKFRAAEFFAAPELLDGDDCETTISADVHLPPAFGGKLETMLDWLRARNRKNQTVVISTSHARRVREILADGSIQHVHLLDSISENVSGSVLIFPQRLATGFGFSTEEKIGGLWILTDSELFGWQRTGARVLAKTRRKKSAAKSGEKTSALSNLTDLQEGDFVVHINHGIARYAGVMRQELAGAVNDYLLLEYAGSDRLYVPVAQLDRVQKYLGSDSASPPLNQLRGTSWANTKKKVREETIQVAKQLSELYAARENAHKEPLGGDTPWQREMESAFPYEETGGQLQAIKDVKSDLESDKPMDRLVCGDVGFGKTEVAVRAAFKVVQEGKQVAILVPTTVLAQQHYQTFSERLAAYPTRIDVLSRFRTPAEQRRTIEEVKQGAVDILIGTHRLVQKDVEFRDLGLVIVDEEQRFGVMQKERLKEMRKEVDILTLSATPIPRTLHFALGGLREMSLITDPPAGRLPVRTFVMPFKDEIVRQSIEREIEREGQVYYVHNRISSIAHIAEKLKQLVPHARIGIGHGQMGDEELEQVMLDFMHHRSDVLLATTIIENGLDLPNVNTLIVDRAELLGLSQMYQLRGRVGRSPRQGYAYFFSGSRGKLGEAAEDRFAAMQEHTDLGAGFKIAMRDLEIRGAGDLLGLKQSGSIAQVGFEMYTEMLSEAVARVRHQPVKKREELPEADLPVPAFLPAEYVADERDRLNLYRKLAGVSSGEEAKHLQDELRDRFGPLPAPAHNLLRVLRIRVLLHQARLRGISKNDTEILIRLHPGDRFREEDTAAVYARLNQSFDARALQNVSLRPMEGIVIDTRILSATQLMRMVEESCEQLAAVRGARFYSE